MNELIKRELSNNIGKKVLIFLNNNFRYEGIILDFDDEFLKIRDFKSRFEKIILISKISEIDVTNNGY